MCSREKGFQSSDGTSDAQVGPSRRFSLSPVVISILVVINIAANVCTHGIVARLFGASVTTDAFYVVSTVPTLATSIVSGSLTLVLVPLLMEVKGHARDVQTLFSTILNFVVLLMATVFVVVTLFPSFFLRCLVPDFPSEGIDLAATMVGPMFASGVFTCASSVLAGYCYFRKRVVLPTLAQMINGIVILAFVASFGSFFGIHSAVWGTLGGGVAQFLVLIFTAWDVYRPSIALRSPVIRRAIRIAFPLIVGLLLYRTISVLERSFASHLPSGSVSLLAYSFRAVYTLSTVTTFGISTLLLPTASELVSDRRLRDLRATFLQSFRTAFFVTLPLMAWLILVREPLLSLLFYGGEFGSGDVKVTSTLVLWELGVLFANGVGGVIVNTLYSLSKTFVTIVVSLAGLILYCLIGLVAVYTQSIIGLAAAMSAFFLLTLSAYFYVLYRELDGFALLPECKYVGRLIVSSALAFSLAMLVTWASRGLFAGLADHIAWILELCSATIATALFFVLFSLLLHVPEARALLHLVRSTSSTVRGVSGAASPQTDESDHPSGSEVVRRANLEGPVME